MHDHFLFLSENTASKRKINLFTLVIKMYILSATCSTTGYFLNEKYIVLRYHVLTILKKSTKVIIMCKKPSSHGTLANEGGQQF